MAFVKLWRRSSSRRLERGGDIKYFEMNMRTYRSSQTKLNNSWLQFAKPVHRMTYSLAQGQPMAGCSSSYYILHTDFSVMVVGGYEMYSVQIGSTLVILSTVPHRPVENVLLLKWYAINTILVLDDVTPPASK